MSIAELPANAIDDVEPDRVTKNGSRHIAPEDSPDDEPSLAEMVESYPETDDSQHALKYGSSRHARKRRIVAELLDRGRDTLARRVGSCGNDSKRCNRPHLCRLCLSSKRGHAKRRHADWVRSWDDHVLVALTMPSTSSHPTVARKDVRDRFNRVRRRVGFTDVVSRAFGGVHTVEDRDTEEFRAHVDLLCEPRQTAAIGSELTEVWADVDGGHVETTSVTAQSDGTYADAVEATTCYVVEKTDLAPGDAVDYASVRPEVNHWMTFGKGI